MKVEGSKTESETISERGRPISHSASHDGSGKAAEMAVPFGMRMVGFEAGRTIELKRFEFCRIRLWARVYFPEGVPKERAEEAIERFVQEMLRREEESVSGRKVDVHIPDADLGVLQECVHRTIGVLYGLTLKSGKNEFESNVVDVIEELPVSDGEDLIAAFDRLSDEMAEKLDKHHKRIKETG